MVYLFLASGARDRPYRIFLPFFQPFVCSYLFSIPRHSSGGVLLFSFVCSYLLYLVPYWHTMREELTWHHRYVVLFVLFLETHNNKQHQISRGKKGGMILIRIDFVFFKYHRLSLLFTFAHISQICFLMKIRFSRYQFSPLNIIPCMGI